MANLNNRAKAEHTYDAIVVGSGISGGWAAKELTQKGLKTLVLERGRMVRHLEDYPTAATAPWETAIWSSRSAGSGPPSPPPRWPRPPPRAPRP